MTERVDQRDGYRSLACWLRHDFARPVENKWYCCVHRASLKAQHGIFDPIVADKEGY